MTNADAMSTQISRGMRTAALGWVIGVADTIHQYAVRHRRPRPSPPAVEPHRRGCRLAAAIRSAGRRSSGGSAPRAGGAGRPFSLVRSPRPRPQRPKVGKIAGSGFGCSRQFCRRPNDQTTKPARTSTPSGMPQVCSRSSQTAPRLGTGSPRQLVPGERRADVVAETPRRDRSPAPRQRDRCRQPDPSVRDDGHVAAPRRPAAEALPREERTLRPARVGCRHAAGGEPHQCTGRGVEDQGVGARVRPDSGLSRLRSRRSLDPSGDTRRTPG